MNIVKLKNGSEEDEALVAVAMVSLRSLMAEKPMVLYGLVMKCRDDSHQLFGNAGDELEKLGLATQMADPRESGNVTIHGSLRNIVLSAVKGDGLEMTLGSPLAPETTS